MEIYIYGEGGIKLHLVEVIVPHFIYLFIFVYNLIVITEDGDLNTE